MNKYTQSTIKTLKDEGQITLTISDSDFQEKAKFLIILAYEELIQIYYDHDTNSYTYTLRKDGVYALEQFLLKNNPQELEGKYSYIFEESGEDDNAEEEYFQFILKEIVFELDRKEVYSISAYFDEEDEDWAMKMQVLMELHNRQMISMEFCAEHMHFNFEIDERHCELYSEHNGKTFEEIRGNKIIKSNIIH